MKSTGLVLGKFLPFHSGHALLISFAKHFIENVDSKDKRVCNKAVNSNEKSIFVVVDNIPWAEISGTTRVNLISQTFPDVNVLYLPNPNPQSPEETPHFWDIWKATLEQLLPCAIDYVFASESYGFKLAEILQATFIPFDITRQYIPISGSLIRQNPLKYTHYVATGCETSKKLKNPTKPQTLKKICLFGPESTGKTTLAKELSTHFNTHWVPEYAINYLEAKSYLTENDLLYVACGQIALESAIISMGRSQFIPHQIGNMMSSPISKDFEYIFCDTDALITCLWSRWLFGNCSETLLNLALAQHYDLYLLLSPDIPWKADKYRYLPEKSLACFTDCMNLLNKYQRKYSIISGSGSERIHNAIEKSRCVE